MDLWQRKSAVSEKEMVLSTFFIMNIGLKLKRWKASSSRHKSKVATQQLSTRKYLNRETCARSTFSVRQDLASFEVRMAQKTTKNMDCFRYEDLCITDISIYIYIIGKRNKGERERKMCIRKCNLDGMDSPHRTARAQHIILYGTSAHNSATTKGRCVESDGEMVQLIYVYTQNERISKGRLRVCFQKR